MSTRSRLTLCLAALLLGAASVQANDLTITSVSLTGQNTASGFILVQFDVIWYNSWRVTDAPYNWDAVWIFIKYRTGGGRLEARHAQHVGPHRPGRFDD